LFACDDDVVDSLSSCVLVGKETATFVVTVSSPTLL
jgi:hypothetical protein